jgi:hypothetical protein
MGFKKYQVLPQTPKWLVSFYIKNVYSEQKKTSQKYTFLGRQAHIPIHLDVKVLYVIFWSFEKYQNRTQNSNGFAFVFPKNTNPQRKTCKILYFLAMRLLRTASMAIRVEKLGEDPWIG